MDPSLLNDDFQELLKLLDKHQVKYLLVGGYAIAFFGLARQTKTSTHGWPLSLKMRM